MTGLLLVRKHQEMNSAPGAWEGENVAKASIRLAQRMEDRTRRHFPSLSALMCAISALTRLMSSITKPSGSSRTPIEQRISGKQRFRAGAVMTANAAGGAVLVGIEIARHRRENR